MIDAEKPVEDAPPPTQEDVQELSRAVYDMTAMMTEVVTPGLTRLQKELATTQEEKVGRAESRQRARRSITLVIAAVLIALVLNTLFVIGLVVPKCYNGSARAEPHSSCNLIPGYKKQREQSRDLLRQFDQSQQDLANEIRDSKDRQAANSARIRILEKKLGIPDPTVTPNQRPTTPATSGP